MPNAPLFAVDVGLLLKVAIFMIVGVIWVVGQLMAKLNKTRENAAAPPAENFPGAPPPVRRAPVQAVDDEVEAFLRKAAQAKGARPTAPSLQPAGERRGPNRPPRQQPPARAPMRPQPATGGMGSAMPQAPAPAAYAQVEVVDSIKEGSRLSSVEQHVAAHMDTGAFAERANQLTRVDNADELMQEHIQQSLDHKLGQLGGSVSVTGDPRIAAAKTESPAAAIAAMLSTPDGMRNAIILNEILRRPDLSRW